MVDIILSSAKINTKYRVVGKGVLTRVIIMCIFEEKIKYIFF